MSKIDLQQERESLKSTLFTEEIENVNSALNTLHNNLMKLEDSLYKESNSGKYLKSPKGSFQNRPMTDFVRKSRVVKPHHASLFLSLTNTQLFYCQKVFLKESKSEFVKH